MKKLLILTITIMPISLFFCGCMSQTLRDDIKELGNNISNFGKDIAHDENINEFVDEISKDAHDFVVDFDKDGFTLIDDGKE